MNRPKRQKKRNNPSPRSLNNKRLASEEASLSTCHCGEKCQELEIHDEGQMGKSTYIPLDCENENSGVAIVVDHIRLWLVLDLEVRPGKSRIPMPVHVPSDIVTTVRLRVPVGREAAVVAVVLLRTKAHSHVHVLIRRSICFPRSHVLCDCVCIGGMGDAPILLEVRQEETCGLCRSQTRKQVCTREEQVAARRDRSRQESKDGRELHRLT